MITNTGTMAVIIFTIDERFKDIQLTYAPKPENTPNSNFRTRIITNTGIIAVTILTIDERFNDIQTTPIVPAAGEDKDFSSLVPSDVSDLNKN